MCFGLFEDHRYVGFGLSVFWLDEIGVFAFSVSERGVQWIIGAYISEDYGA
jgi:hypothetical protein